MRSQKTPFRVLLVNLEISHYIKLIYKKVKQLDSAKAGKDLKRKFLVKIRAVAKPCGPKWGAKRDQTLSCWFTNCILLIFNQGKAIWVSAEVLKEKKTWFRDFESTLIRKTVILQRKESSNWKIQEKEPLLTFKNTLKKVWAKRKCQFLDSRRALLRRFACTTTWGPETSAWHCISLQVPSLHDACLRALPASRSD